MSDSGTDSPMTYTREIRPPRLGKLPKHTIVIAVILVVASWIPLALIARGRTNFSPDPRVHIMQDMGTQPRYREQQTSEIFADGRAARPPVSGTVARGKLFEDDHYYRGFSKSADEKSPVKFFDGYPSTVKVDAALIERGQQRYNIYCATCHGFDGYGKGPVAVRSAEIETPLNPSSFHASNIHARPEGHLFNTITVGIRNMPGYGGQIPPADRWAIVAYVRALQVSQGVTPVAGQ